MIISAIGNFMVIINITSLVVCFEEFKITQSECFYKQDAYLYSTSTAGLECMKDWVDSKQL
jgi:hypothetical protein